MKSLVYCTKLDIHPLCNRNRKFSQETNDMTLSETGEKLNSTRGWEMN